jgi:hypothetical protein
MGHHFPRGVILAAALLESDDDDHSYRTFEDQRVPAASTRTDSNNSIAEDKTHASHDYHFGQSFKPDATTKQFSAGTDIIDVSFIVLNVFCFSLRALAAARS